MNLSDLGTPIGPMARVDAKSSSRVYRLDTDQGSFAVKELNLDRGLQFQHDHVFRFEQAAFAAGVPMPEPVSADPHMLVHRWVEGDKMPEEPVSRAFAAEIGGILARIHALDVTWTPVTAESPPPRDWALLTERAEATGQPWSEELASQTETLLAIAEFVETCERPGPIVLTHRDIHPWNLLNRNGRPVVLDWELSGMLDLGSELGSTALSLSKGSGFENVDPDVFRSVLDGYVAGGGTLPPPGLHWFVFMIGGWLGFTRWNIKRCLSGDRAPRGRDLVTCHEEVRNGLHGLPEMFKRLPALEELLLRR